jgi:hypothetical protein
MSFGSWLSHCATQDPMLRDWARYAKRRDARIAANKAKAKTAKKKPKAKAK